MLINFESWLWNNRLCKLNQYSTLALKAWLTLIPMRYSRTSLTRVRLTWITQIHGQTDGVNLKYRGLRINEVLLYICYLCCWGKGRWGDLVLGRCWCERWVGGFLGWDLGSGRHSGKWIIRYHTWIRVFNSLKIDNIFKKTNCIHRYISK